MAHRPGSAVVDLTSGSRLALQNHHDYNPISFQTSTSSHHSGDSRGIKRQRISAGPSHLHSRHSRVASSSSDHPAANLDLDPLDSVDLTEVNDDSALSQILAKQRADAVKAQAAAEHREGRTSLTATKCAICMDTPTDATTTICGHLFCHKCIIDSLRYEEERSEATTGKSMRGKCPACRKFITRRDTPGTKRDLIPLQFKLKRPS